MWTLFMDGPQGANCERYPDAGGRLRQVHSLQMTEHFIVVPETNYMSDPCVRVQRNISQVGDHLDMMSVVNRG